jgi:hypothetical protein
VSNELGEHDHPPKLAYVSITPATLGLLCGYLVTLLSSLVSFAASAVVVLQRNLESYAEQH